MPLRHVLNGRDTAGGIYGTVVATSVVVGLSKDKELTPGQALLILTVTTTVFMLAKVYSLSLSERTALGTLSSWGRAVEMVRYEWPMLRAAVPAAFAIVLWWAGLCGRSTGLWLAVGLGVAELALLGIVYGLNEGQGPWRALRLGAFDASLGLALVAVKALVG